MQIRQIDASKIPAGIWNRTDFPFEKFFNEMDNDPQLAQKVAKMVDSFIEQSQCPPRAVSVLISLNEDGEIANWTTCTEGGFMGPSEEELRAIEERKREKQEEREAD